VLAASGGGHFSLLDALADVIPQEHREWVTVPGPRGQALTRQGETLVTLPPTDASHLDLTNPIRSVVAAFKLRPQVVVSSGAGVVLTFVLTCWLLGARVVFLETMARVSSPSRTGRILGHLATLHVVQWPELRRLFPSAVLCRPVLLPRVFGHGSAGIGTFVSVGTHSESFDRLLQSVDVALQEGILPQPCIAQVGPSRFSSPRMSTAGTVAPSVFNENIANSGYVIGHCGAGLISGALRAGRRPMVMARRAERGEHVDDHQLQLAEKLSELGLVVPIEGAIDAEAIRSASSPLDTPESFAHLPEARDLIEEYLSPLWGALCKQ
jgi:UDP-N-acetylglucosamine--N-acetylmuramyl-(pentapeptide) pyrophosphoryl-undecaprenol N-acetylglucosamine transferase